MRGLGDELLPGMVVPCPRCGDGKRHRVLKPESENQKLLYIKCNGELIVVALEGRYLPAVPQGAAA